MNIQKSFNVPNVFDPIDIFSTAHNAGYVDSTEFLDLGDALDDLLRALDVDTNTKDFMQSQESCAPTNNAPSTVTHNAASHLSSSPLTATSMRSNFQEPSKTPSTNAPTTGTPNKSQQLSSSSLIAAKTEAVPRLIIWHVPRLVPLQPLNLHEAKFPSKRVYMQKKQGRSKDQRKRKKRRCLRCVENDSPNAEICRGRSGAHGRDGCEYFDKDGSCRNDK